MVELLNFIRKLENTASGYNQNVKINSEKLKFAEMRKKAEAEKKKKIIMKPESEPLMKKVTTKSKPDAEGGKSTHRTG